MTTETVLAALKGVTDPDLGVDLVTLKFVKDKDITIDGGRVSVAIEMATPSPSKRDAVSARVREAVAAIPGVQDVAVTTSFQMRDGLRGMMVNFLSVTMLDFHFTARRFEHLTNETVGVDVVRGGNLVGRNFQGAIIQDLNPE